jgi:hypothetical protein
VSVFPGADHPPSAHTIRCPACEAELPATAARCPHCGATTAVAGVQSARGVARRRERLRDNRWFILALLFGVTAVFGLPWLWSSRGFSRPAKIVLSVVVVLYTALLLWLTWLILRWSCGSISHSLKPMR